MFGVRCPGCGRQRWWPCPDCCAALEPVAVPPVPGVDRVAALFAHDGVGRSIVAAAKYRPPRAGQRWLAAALAALVPAGDVPDIVTWVPASHTRRRHVGSDPGASLARRVAAHLGVPARAVLIRGSDRPQTLRTHAERRWGPSLTATGTLRAARTLVVDDVVTTGSSLRVAAGALRAAGARSISAVAVAHRPRRATGAVDSIGRHRQAGEEMRRGTDLAGARSRQPSGS